MTTSTRTRLQLIPTEAVLLRPRVAGTPSSRWPLLVFVLDESYANDPRSRQLYDLFDHGGKSVPPCGFPEWSVDSALTPALRLRVEASDPELDLDVVIPARPLLEQGQMLRHISTVALTSKRHMRWLTPGTDLRDVLSRVVLVGPLPTAQLAELALLTDVRG